jgi:hypothetical protein
MKYFTPDLLARFGSDDDAVADAASVEWEQALAAYLQHLQAIRGELPRRVRHLLDRFNLHDARVSTLAIDRELLSVTLQFGNGRGRGVQLNYRLAAEPKITHHPVPGEETTPLEWLYDELALVKEESFVLYKHNILFTRGWELELVFHSLGVRRYRKVLFPGRQQPLGGLQGDLELLAT